MCKFQKTNCYFLKQRNVDFEQNNIIIYSMKKLIAITFLFFGLLFSPAFAAGEYEELYQNAQLPDFELVHSIDPYQNEDYQKYAWSPYPLFRLASDVRFKTQIIPAGYYILTPRTMNGKDYIFFKEAGKVKFIIPVVKKELVPVDFYHNNMPTPKYTKWQKFCKSVRDGFYTIFRNSSRKSPPPSSYIVSENIEGDMYLIILYYGETKYHIVFKAGKY